MNCFVRGEGLHPLPNPPPLSREREQTLCVIGLAQTPIVSVPSPASEAKRGRDREGAETPHPTTSSIAAKRYAFFTPMLERYRL